MKRLMLLAAAALLSACQPATAGPTANFAVYAEYSPSTKPMVAGWNTRVFNTREVQQGSAIALDTKTGIITLAPGVYHVLATSIVTYFDSKTPATVPIKSSPGGYARLRNAADPVSISNDKALALSTIGTADMTPCLVDTYLRIDKRTSILLEHQVGKEVKGIYLHVNVENSSDHVFARISIQRLV